MVTPTTQACETSTDDRAFAAYYRHWLATYARHHCKPGTVSTCTGISSRGRIGRRWMGWMIDAAAAASHK